MGKLLKQGEGEGSVGSGTVREQVLRKRDELFRSGWKNQKQLTPLVSREEDNKFRFLVEWCEEFEEVLHKHRERLSDPNPRIRQRSGATSTKTAHQIPVPEGGQP